LIIVAVVENLFGTFPRSWFFQSGRSAALAQVDLVKSSKSWVIFLCSETTKIVLLLRVIKSTLSWAYVEKIFASGVFLTFFQKNKMIKWKFK
jgi:hypothetical protein